MKRQPRAREANAQCSFLFVNIVESTVFYESWLADQTNLQNKQLDRKHEQMASGPFPFLRATFYRWLQRWPKVCGNLDGRNEDVLLAVGDLHVENFGTWRDSRNRLAWGINDFDEACGLPFTLDLVRLATSILLAAEAVEIETTIDEVAGALIAGYEDGVKAGGAPILLEQGTCQELEALVSVVNEPPASFWARKLGDDENPEIRPKELPRGLGDIFRSALPRGSTPVYRRERRPGGLGSLGRRRYLAILRQGDDPCIALEAKAIVPSALSWLEMRPAARSLAATMLQRAVRSPDPWLQVHDRWLVRQLAPDALKIELPASGEDSRLVFAPALLRSMGFETANVHLGSRSPGGLQKSLERLRLDLGDRWLATATGQMERVTRKDHLVWTKYWKRHLRKSENDES
jgi:Uncharacterized protein conserved in bacteria (DUF2252)